MAHRDRYEWFVGESAVMRELARRAERLAQSDLPLLIQGETGTGKELLARAVHAQSPRARKPFVSENCAALSESLLEDELFGHEPGAFTGARGGRDGLFARAHGGTLFLDEVGDMPPAMQAKLLRVLQEGEVRRLGGDRAQRVDVRVITATHRDLDRLVEAQRFRADLQFRLAVLRLQLPPLRERLEDLPRLAGHVLARLAAGGEVPPLSLAPDALELLARHSWPGNVRELENALRVAALDARDGLIVAESLERWQAEADPVLEQDYARFRAELLARERRYVAAALQRARGNKSLAARELEISRYALYRTLRRLGLSSSEPQLQVHPGTPRRKTG